MTTQTPELIEIFIEKLLIEKVRHLQNLEITLSQTERQHLILTGPNGSGKTSILNQLKLVLSDLSQESNKNESISSWLKPDHMSIYEHFFKAKFERLPYFIQCLKEQQNNDKPSELELSTNEFKTLIEEKFKHWGIVISLKSIENMLPKFHNGEFLLAAFDAKRNLKLELPQGIQQLEFKSNYAIEDSLQKVFLQYLVNLKASRSFARDDGDHDTADKIDAWFERFEKLLNDLFEDGPVELEFDRKQFTFHLKQANKEPFGFDTLSDGYSSILSIVSELLLRMESKSLLAYDMQGIVIIDEIEAHLHLSLQKKILPFLTTLFPRIQFIVSTHSPFVLSSISNTVIYDLAEQEAVHDLTNYSYTSIVESYFEQDQYSQDLKNKLDRYEFLLKQSQLAEAEQIELDNLHEELESAPTLMSPELELRLQSLKLKQPTSA